MEKTLYRSIIIILNICSAKPLGFQFDAKHSKRYAKYSTNVYECEHQRL